MLAQFSSVSRSCPTHCDPMDWSTPGLSVHCQLAEFNQTHVHWVGDANQPSRPLSTLLFLPSIFPSIRVFSSESVLHIRWPKYWSFSFSISPPNEYLGLISFRMDWLDLLDSSDGKESTYTQETWIWFLQGKIPWRRDCKPLQYSCLENLGDRRA